MIQYIAHSLSMICNKFGSQVPRIEAISSNFHVNIRYTLCHNSTASTLLLRARILLAAILMGSVEQKRSPLLFLRLFWPE